MKESTKEWLGIKPADFIIYSGFICLIPAYFTTYEELKSLFLVIGLVLCLISCKHGMSPHLELNKFNNTVKKIAYPAVTALYLWLGYSIFVQ